MTNTDQVGGPNAGRRFTPTTIATSNRYCDTDHAPGSGSARAPPMLVVKLSPVSEGKRSFQPTAVHTPCVVAPIRNHAFFEQVVLERLIGMVEAASSLST